MHQKSNSVFCGEGPYRTALSPVTVRLRGGIVWRFASWNEAMESIRSKWYLVKLDRVVLAFFEDI